MLTTSDRVDGDAVEGGEVHRELRLVSIECRSCEKNPHRTRNSGNSTTHRSTSGRGCVVADVVFRKPLGRVASELVLPAQHDRFEPAPQRPIGELRLQQFRKLEMNSAFVNGLWFRLRASAEALLRQ